MTTNGLQHRGLKQRFNARITTHGSATSGPAAPTTRKGDRRGRNTAAMSSSPDKLCGLAPHLTPYPAFPTDSNLKTDWNTSMASATLAPPLIVRMVKGPDPTRKRRDRAGLATPARPLGDQWGSRGPLRGSLERHDATPRHASKQRPRALAVRAIP